MALFRAINLGPIGLDSSIGRVRLRGRNQFLRAFEFGGDAGSKREQVITDWLYGASAYQLVTANLTAVGQLSAQPQVVSSVSLTAVALLLGQPNLVMSGSMTGVAVLTAQPAPPATLVSASMTAVAVMEVIGVRLQMSSSLTGVALLTAQPTYVVSAGLTGVALFSAAPSLQVGAALTGIALLTAQPELPAINVSADLVVTALLTAQGYEVTVTPPGGLAAKNVTQVIVFGGQSGAKPRRR
jgi:hypothetical protein